MNTHSDNNSTITGAVADIDLDRCIPFFEKHGRQQFGQGFHIHPADRSVIYKLLIYFLRHEPEAARLGIDLNKGIFLRGPVGCGKTALMTLMKFVPAPEHNYVMKPCRDISLQFSQEGYSVVSNYSTLSFNSQRPRSYCFDDLGAERSLKYYGNECNVMTEILMSRYDLFRSCGMITHITSNLTAAELEAHYSDRVRSRVREMCNQISFDAASPDKRI